MGHNYVVRLYEIHIMNYVNSRSKGCLSMAQLTRENLALYMWWGTLRGSSATSNSTWMNLSSKICGDWKEGFPPPKLVSGIILIL